MFQSTLLKRTMTLVVLSLLASAILATIAFVVAGNSKTMEIEINNALKQDTRYMEILTTHPEYFESSDFRYFFFDSSYASGHDYYLVSTDGTPVNYTAIENRSLSVRDTHNLVPNLNQLSFDSLNGLGYYIADPLKIDVDEMIIISRFPLMINGNPYYLYSLSYLNSYDSLIVKYLNILLLSTLMAAAAMLVPAYAFVSRMVLPLQEINEVAMEYGKGNFNVRADESHKGEIGELGHSFNFLADRLSKSINDLTAERNQLQDIFDVISDGIVVVDSKAVPVTTNKAIHKLFERADKNNLFTERLQLIPFDDVWKDFEDCITTGEPKTRQIDNRDYAYQCTIIPKYDSSDNTTIIGATGFFRDIFEEQKNERFRQDYVANISHELRTPLQTLRGLIEPLSDGMVKKESDRQRYYQIILNETMRLSRLIDDMLELSKLQSRTLAFKTFPFNLNDLINSIEIRFRPIMKEAGIKFSVQNNYGDLPTVIGNRAGPCHPSR